jgi:hypothetical protein
MSNIKWPTILQSIQWYHCFVYRLQIVLIHTHSPPHLAKIIGIPTYDHPDIYTVVFPDGSISEFAENILEATNSPSPVPSDPTLPHWIQGGSNATLFLSNMAKPRHGKLYKTSDGQWKFCPGNTVEQISPYCMSFPHNVIICVDAIWGSLPLFYPQYGDVVLSVYVLKLTPFCSPSDSYSMGFWCSTCTIWGQALNTPARPSQICNFMYNISYYSCIL